MIGSSANETGVNASVNVPVTSNGYGLSSVRPTLGWLSGFTVLPSPLNVYVPIFAGAAPTPRRVIPKASAVSVPVTGPTAVGAKTIGMLSVFPAPTVAGSEGNEG